MAQSLLLQLRHWDMARLTQTIAPQRESTALPSPPGIPLKPDLPAPALSRLLEGTVPEHRGWEGMLTGTSSRKPSGACLTLLQIALPGPLHPDTPPLTTLSKSTLWASKLPPELLEDPGSALPCPRLLTASPEAAREDFHGAGLRPLPTPAFIKRIRGQ